MDTSVKYLKSCKEDERMQKEWTPATGDYVYRSHSIFGKEIDGKIWDKDQMDEVLILTHQSGADGWFHAANSVTGESRTFDSKKEFDKETCIWLPRVDQIMAMSYEIHYKGYNVSLLIDFTEWVNEQWTVSGRTVHSWEWLWLEYFKRFTR